MIGYRNYPGASYSNPVESTPALHGNISHLQIVAYVDKAYVVWQDYNSTTDLSSIFVSQAWTLERLLEHIEQARITLMQFIPR